MLNILICVLCSVAVSVFLKVVRKQNIAVDQAIVVNYVVATGLTVYFLHPDMSDLSKYESSWPVFVALGLLLPSVFLVMAAAVRSVGIVKSDAAQRLSLFIPIVSAYLIFGEVLNTSRMVGIGLACVALLCLLVKSEKGRASGSWGANALVLLGVWLGYGTIDVLFKQLAKSGNAFGGNLLIAFALAGVLMLAYVLLKRTRWSRASLLGGVLLGVLNFANILFYVKSHQALKDNPTLVFAGVSLGVMALGALVGVVVFRERLSRLNVVGVLMAMASIVCLFYWPVLTGLLPK
ncbi:hypothetical protein DTO96_100874 [Ephemeroptericola cinctiostellae]|uniref:EamA domain-containing protein n=1 Tax=Ephemeroptericola cinctiostellae TaxID=2268024 RepID=A0A345D9W6_9BURK|nr:EamA/RhaT family transporter [Ephemeroptericola cinctiostellae]AXF85154.1 hypothetical protein DTO96_100874 [Ephemeroptericola cinctiostellae]